MYYEKTFCEAKHETASELKFGRRTYFGWCPPPPLPPPLPSPPFKTAWQKSDSYAFPYHQWEPIRNRQLIRKYQYIYKDIDTKGWCPPPPLPSTPLETSWRKSDSYTFPYHQWEPIRNSQLIRKYKKIPVYKDIDTKCRWTPPVNTCRDQYQIWDEVHR